jgi:hypothetical protein
MTALLDISTWSILQWVLVVLAAGFIGQFGKSLAQFIMAKVKAGRSAGKTVSPLPVPDQREKTAPEAPTVPPGKGAMPTEITYPGRDLSSAKDIVSGQSAPPVLDKKALKAILKQQKKAAKASK